MRKSTIVAENFSSISAKDFPILNEVTDRLGKIKVTLTSNDEWYRVHIDEKVLLVPKNPLLVNCSMVTLKRTGYLGRKKPLYFCVGDEVFTLKIPSVKELRQVKKVFKDVPNVNINSISVDGVKVNRVWCDPENDHLTSPNVYNLENNRCTYLNEYERSFSVGCVFVLVKN